MNRSACRTRPLFRMATAVVMLLLLHGCGKEAPKTVETGPVGVTVVTVERRDVPAVGIYVAQTQSSQAVNIQARVSGFLDKRVYVEGSVVKDGQILFQMDQKPFQAQVEAAKAALQRNQAALDVAKANLARVKPLTRLNALSQKDLDDATGQYDSPRPRSSSRRPSCSRRRSSTSPTRPSPRRSTAYRVRGGGRRDLPQPAEQRS